MIGCGATTIWERWDSYLKDSGPNKDGMNSFNHYSLGSVGEWLYRSIVGIAPTFDKPDFKQVVVKPYFNESVSRLSASLKTINGIIKVKYQTIDQKIIYEISGDKLIEFKFDFCNTILSRKR